jgi:hypothetical protein
MKIKDLLANIDNYSDDDKYKLMYSLFSIRSVNEIPPDVFQIVSAFMLVIALADEQEGLSIKAIEATEILSLMTCQLLALSGHLKNIPALPEEDINKVTIPTSLPENWEDNVLKGYKAHAKELEKRELFLEALAKLSKNKAILTAASNFVYYQTKHNLGESEEVERNLGLINLIKLSIKEQIVIYLKDLLDKYFNINLIKFLSENTEAFISIYANDRD